MRRQLVRFFILGAFSTFVDYLLYSTLILFGVNYIFAIILGYSAGLYANYEIGRRYVFTRGRKLKNAHQEFVVVALIAVGGLLLNMGTVKLLSFGLWRLDPLISRLVAIGVTFVWNFVLRKRYVYH